MRVKTKPYKDNIYTDRHGDRRRGTISDKIEDRQTDRQKQWAGQRQRKYNHKISQGKIQDRVSNKDTRKI